MVISGTVRIPKTKGAQLPHKGNGNHFVFRARPANKDEVYIGGPDITPDQGLTLAPGDIVTVNCFNAVSTSQFWAAALQSDDRIDFIAT